MAFWTQSRLGWNSYLQGLCQVIMWQPIIYLKSAWKDRWPVILGWLLGLTWILLKLNLPDDLYWRRTELNKEFDSCPFTTWPEGQGLGFGEHLNRERANYIFRWLIQKLWGAQISMKVFSFFFLIKVLILLFQYLETTQGTNPNVTVLLGCSYHQEPHLASSSSHTQQWSPQGWWFQPEFPRKAKVGQGGSVPWGRWKRRQNQWSWWHYIHTRRDLLWSGDS